MGQNWHNMTQFLSHFGSEKILSDNIRNITKPINLTINLCSFKYLPMSYEYLLVATFAPEVK